MKKYLLILAIFSLSASAFANSSDDTVVCVGKTIESITVPINSLQEISSDSKTASRTIILHKGKVLSTSTAKEPSDVTFKWVGKEDGLLKIDQEGYTVIADGTLMGLDENGREKLIAEEMVTCTYRF